MPQPIIPQWKFDGAQIASSSIKEQQYKPEKMVESKVKQNLPGLALDICPNKLQQALAKQYQHRPFACRSAESIQETNSAVDVSLDL